MSINNLIQNCIGKKFSGTLSIIHFICEKDVLSVPAFLPENNPGDTITFDGDISLKSGKVWKKIPIIIDSGEIIKSATGITTAKAYSNVFNFRIIKNKASDEWVQKHINVEAVFIIKEKIGINRVLGNIGTPAFLSLAEGKTGSNLDSEKFWNLQITDTTGCVAPVYNGEIKTKLSDFNNDFNNDFA